MRPTVSIVFSLLGLGSAGVLATACEEADCSEYGCASSQTDAGDGDAVSVDGSPTDGPTPPPGCDPTADPKDAPKCVVSEFGVFVDATNGSDGNPGTKESPVKTIGAALTKLGGKERVYICEGTYAEQVTLTVGASLYGAFACGTWSYTGNATKLSPTARGATLSVSSVTAPIVVADIEATAQDASDPGESSVAIFVANATKVTLRRVKATAGKAMDGADAANQSDFSPPNAPDGTTGANGGAETPNPMCPTSVGGAGGKDGAASGGPGRVAITPEYPAGYTGAGGVAGASCAPLDGSYGIAGASGAGATKLGALDGSGWKADDGSPGGRGGDAQGGGGGGQKASGGIGGSGGPGGCGGSGGANGGGAGASVALLLFQSSVDLEQCSLVAKDAGRGGNGGKGQKAQLASPTQATSNGANGCAGGYGGIGGSGGGGGGGAGGVSAGVVYKGTPPKIDGADVTSADTHPSATLGQKGVAGLKGAGGDAAQMSVPVSRAGTDGNDGIAGEAKAVMSAP